MPPLARTAATLFLAGHLLTGALRPVLALDPIGKMLPGLPGSAPGIEIQKVGMDWRMDRLAEQLRGCHGVILNIRHPFMQLAARMVATDLGVSWASLHPIDLRYTVWPPYQPAGWDLAGCIASDDISDLHAGRRVIWVVSAGRPLNSWTRLPVHWRSASADIPALPSMEPMPSRLCRAGDCGGPRERQSFAWRIRSVPLP
jgi:hypothetical protein